MLKIHAVYSTVYHSIQSIVITTERTHDGKKLQIGPEVQNTLLINDLGYYSLKTFSKIHNFGGFFISRVKSNAIPEVNSILSVPSDFSSIVDISLFKS